MFSYNGLQQITRANINSTDKPGYDNRTIAYTYDPLDRISTLADSGSLNNTITYAYDGVGNVAKETVAASQTSSLSYNYDADSRRTSTAVAGSGNSTATGYGYDAGSRLTTLTFTANGNSLGQLTYQYDNDSRVTGEIGSLASINLPHSEGTSSPGTYSSTNQVTSWNGTGASADAASSLTTDPTTPGASFSWDSRNQLSSITGGPAGSFAATYDAKMRRYNQTTAYGGTTTYLHDQRNVAQSNSTVGQAINNYLTMPGTGEVLAFSTNNGTYVPLQDGSGSTIGLVNSSNVLRRGSLLQPGPRTPAPAGESGINNSVASSQGSGGGLSAADGAAQAGGVLTAGLAAYGAAGAFAGVDSAAAFAIVSLAGPIAWAVMGVTAAILGILDLFDVFGGGGTPVILPAYRRIAHQVQSEFIGSSSVAPNMDNSFNYEAPFGGRVIFVGEPEGHFYLYNRTLPRYKYCGPGNYPVQPNGATDRCCQAHDNCYGANGISSRDVKAGNPGSTGPAQAACDQNLCDCVEGTNPSGPYDDIVQQGIMGVFCGYLP